VILTSVPIAAALLGAFVYGLGSGKAAELGRLAFFAGLLVTLLSLAHAGSIRLP
jgi:hypothetical protein